MQSELVTPSSAVPPSVSAPNVVVVPVVPPAISSPEKEVNTPPTLSPAHSDPLAASSTASSHATSSNALGTPPRPFVSQVEGQRGGARGEKREKITGIYAGDLLPGHYLKTLTGVTRGEELFGRPDYERRWRSGQTQQFKMQLTLKENEIEALMRLCSDLRTKLGNARSDARRIELAVMEKAKKEVAEKEAVIELLKKQLADAKTQETKLKDDTEHQLRLMQAQHENRIKALETELRLSSERLAEQARQCDKQIQDVKEVSAKELQLMETRYGIQLEELRVELQSVRSGAESAEKYHAEQLLSQKVLLQKVEAEFKDSTRRSDERVKEMKESFDRSVERERDEKLEMQSQIRVAGEKLAAALVDVEETTQRWSLWNQFILSSLNNFSTRFMEACPEHVVVVSDPRQNDLPPLYTPRSLQQLPEAKIQIERIVLRLLELEKMPLFSENGGSGPSKFGSEGEQVEKEVQQISARQQRLRLAVRELEGKNRELESLCSALRCRLQYFSDDLRSSSSMPQVVPPLPQQTTFVCLAVFDANVLWEAHPEAMQTAMTYFHSTLRSKRQEYGAYECYADGVCVLLALVDPIAACRLAIDIQEWCLRLPWPETLLKDPSCTTIYAPQGNYPTTPPRLLFHGLRVGAAIHTGPCQLEPTAVPEVRVSPPASASVVPKNSSLVQGSPYREHYYGRGVLQTIHIASFAQGGQILVSEVVWYHQSCAARHYELGNLATVQSLGRYGVLSLQPQTGMEEQQTMEILQLQPNSLAGREFMPTALLLQKAKGRAKMGAAAGLRASEPRGVQPGQGEADSSPRFGLMKGLEKVKNFVIANGVAAMERQHLATEEGLQLVRNEIHEIHNKTVSLMERGKKAKAQFHLLPPPEMVLQLNEIYRILEEVAAMSEESEEEVKQLEMAQDELRVALQGVREFLHRFVSDTDREGAMKVEHEVTLNQLEALLKEAEIKRYEEVEQLKLAIAERDEALRRTYVAA